MNNLMMVIRVILVVISMCLLAFAYYKFGREAGDFALASWVVISAAWGLTEVNDKSKND